jgi:hypothetical protein
MKNTGRNIIGALVILSLFAISINLLTRLGHVNKFTLAGALLLQLVPIMLIFRTVPTYYVGQITRFENRVGGTITEGIVAIIPFIEEINIVFGGTKRKMLGEGDDLFVTPVKPTGKAAVGQDNDARIYFEVISEVIYTTSDAEAALAIPGGDSEIEKMVANAIKSRVRSYTEGKEDKAVIEAKDAIALQVIEELTNDSAAGGHLERKALALCGQTVQNFTVRIVQKPKSIRDAEEESARQGSEISGEQVDATSVEEEALRLMKPRSEGGMGITDPQFAMLAALSRRNKKGVFLFSGGTDRENQAAVWASEASGGKPPTNPT